MGFMDAIGAGINAVAGFIGGHQDRQADKGANQQQKELAEANMAQQREFAKHGVRWKVEDAKAAGIHPMYALGAQTNSFSPVSIGDTRTAHPGDSFRNFGQSVDRAMQATRTEHERRLADLQIKNAELEVEGRALDNQVKASSLAKQNMVGPPLPSPMDHGSQVIRGQGNAFKVKPAEITASAPGRPGQEAGAINSYGYARTASGGYEIVPSSQMKERMEDDFLAETLWHLKNRIVAPPAPDTRQYPIPLDMRKKGYKYWFWNPWKQEYVPSKNP